MSSVYAPARTPRPFGRRFRPSMTKPFFNFYAHNFVRAAVGTPRVRVADPLFNAAATVELMAEAAEQRAVIALFPELGLSAYSCEDLFHQRALLDAVQESLTVVLRASERLPLVAVVGLPLQVDQLLYNCAAVVRSEEHTSE